MKKELNFLIKFDIVDRKNPLEEEFKSWGLPYQDSTMDNVRSIMQDAKRSTKKCKQQTIQTLEC